jgi:uncharacterized protein (TIGR02246 family)
MKLLEVVNRVDSGNSLGRVRRCAHEIVGMLSLALLAGMGAGGSAVAQPADGAQVTEVIAVVEVEAPAASPELVAKIAQEMAATVKAFNGADAEALAGHFMEGGELIDENGNAYVGKAEITGLFKAFFTKFPKAMMELEVTDVRSLGDSLAIEEGVRRITAEDGAAAAQLRYIAVRDKVGDHWPIASYREFADDPLPSPQEMLLSLSWLVGDWVDESPEGRTAISYRWSEDGNFMIGDYTLSVGGLPESQSTQRIGWDAVEGTLRSWTFDSDGGFSEGEWTPTEAGWVVKSEAAMPDGTTGSATVTLAPTDEDHFTVRSSDRIVAGADEPEFELKIARRPPRPDDTGAKPAEAAAVPAAASPAANEAKPAAAAAPTAANPGTALSKPAVPATAPPSSLPARTAPAAKPGAATSPAAAPAAVAPRPAGVPVPAVPQPAQPVAK